MFSLLTCTFLPEHIGGFLSGGYFVLFAIYSGGYSVLVVIYSGGDFVLVAFQTGGCFVLVYKKQWGGFCPGGILPYIHIIPYTAKSKLHNSRPAG